jgi:hypothetical protein
MNLVSAAHRELYRKRREIMRDQMINRRAILKGVVAAPVLFGAVSISLTKTAYAYDWPRTLSQGSSGSDVKELQIRVARGAAAPDAWPSPIGLGKIEAVREIEENAPGGLTGSTRRAHRWLVSLVAVLSLSVRLM